METLSPLEGCFVNNVFLTRTGHKSGGALPGRWPNFATSVKHIGILTRGVDAMEHVSGNGRAPIWLEFSGVTLDLAERVRATGLLADTSVGIARRYRLPGGSIGSGRATQDVTWIFHKVSKFSCTFEYDRFFLSIGFVGELKDIKMLGRISAHPHPTKEDSSLLALSTHGR
jgi:hypothetical protein